jgi:hypothetical protein
MAERNQLTFGSESEKGTGVHELLEKRMKIPVVTGKEKSFPTAHPWMADVK